MLLWTCLGSTLLYNITPLPTSCCCSVIPSVFALSVFLHPRPPSLSPLPFPPELQSDQYADA